MSESVVNSSRIILVSEPHVVALFRPDRESAIPDEQRHFVYSRMRLKDALALTRRNKPVLESHLGYRLYEHAVKVLPAFKNTWFDPKIDGHVEPGEILLVLPSMQIDFLKEVAIKKWFAKNDVTVICIGKKLPDDISASYAHNKFVWRNFSAPACDRRSFLEENKDISVTVSDVIAATSLAEAEGIWHACCGEHW